MKNKSSKPGPIPIATWYIILTELCERFAFYGTSLMFVKYLTQKLGQSTVTATAVNRGFSFFAYLTTIVGAILADSFYGKFKTIFVFCGVYFLGLIFLSVSSLPFFINAGASFPLFILSVYLFIAWGTGGIKSNVSAFAAEQVPDYRIESNTQGYDYDMTIERIFRCFYWAINIGGLGGMIVCSMAYNKANSPTLAFGLPAVVFLIGSVLFYSGKSRYTQFVKKDNALKKAYLCIKYLIKTRGKGHEIILEGSEKQNELWDQEYITGLKKTLNTSKVFVFYIIYWTLYNNMSDAFIFQGSRMYKPSWISGAEILNSFNTIGVIIFIPIFDFGLYPLLRKFGIKMGPITRITLGFIVCSLAFVYAAILQSFIYSSGPYYNFTGPLPEEVDMQFNNISLFWQIPQYVLVAISEIFASCSGLEYAYKHASSEFKSVVIAMFYLTNCLAGLVGLGIAPLSRDPKYLMLFSVEAGVMAFAAVVFYCLFRKQDDEPVAIAEKIQ